MKKILLIDCNWLFNTFYFSLKREVDSLQSINQPADDVTLISHKVITNILKIVQDNQYDEFYTFFDFGGKNFRSELYPEYKQNRNKEPKYAFKEELKHTADALSQLGILPIGCEGQEADDLMSSWAVWKTTHEDCEAHILTKDKDLFQMINDRIFILEKNKDLETKKISTSLFGVEEFKKKFGLERPEQIIDLKAIAGDPSDGYLGVSGVGDITATKLIKCFDNVENLITELKKPELDAELFKSNGFSAGLITKLQSQIEKIELNKKLATIQTNFFSSLNPKTIADVNSSLKPSHINNSIISSAKNQDVPFKQSSYFFSKLYDALKKQFEATKNRKQGL